jgi:hypothetical protein
MADSLPLIACSLSAQERRERLAEWRSVLSAADERREIDGGMQYVFRPADGMPDRVRALAAAESECCAFLRFHIQEQPERLTMTVTTQHPVAQDALRFIFR